MPRTRKTMSGQPAQKVGATAGQVYGAGVEQMALQKAMPAPQVAPVQAPRPAAPTQPGAPEQGPVDFGAVLAKAKEMQSQTGLLAAPTARPNEPITAGLVRGPGAGPEALMGRVGSPAGDLLRMLTLQTGDSYYAEMADRARA